MGGRALTLEGDGFEIVFAVKSYDTMVAAVAPIVSDLKVVSDFGSHLKWLLGNFLPKEEKDKSAVTVRDCDGCR
jgi:hypothetical protein